MSQADLQALQFHHKPNRFSLGKRLGEGAQGTVYALDRVQPATKEPANEWAVKVVPYALQTKRSAAAANARSLHHEYQLLNSLRSLQGTDLPKLPKGSGLKTYESSKEKGWNFLVMERMELNLWEAVRSLPPNGLGKWAVRMLHIVQAVHEKGYVLCDVKPENFMVAGSGNTATTTLTPDRLRLLDLGLFQSWQGMNGGHRPNEGSIGVTGTPLYASLAVHECETCSRRDDVEALLYVWADLLLAVQQQQRTAKNKKSAAKQTDAASYLPWADGKSDDAILDLKRAALDDNLKTLPKAWMDCFDHVRQYKYKTQPDYEWLANKMSLFNLTEMPKGGKKRSGKRTAPVSERRSKRTTRSSQEVEFEDDDPMDIDDDDIRNSSEIDHDLSNVDIVSIPRDNRKFLAACFDVVEGPHKGIKWVMQEGSQEKVLFKTTGKRAVSRLHASWPFPY